MKISLSWLFDFIDYPLSKIDVSKLVHLFNTRTAEIEHYEKVSFDLKDVFVAQVVLHTQKEVQVTVAELQKTIVLSARNDIQLHAYYLVTKYGSSWKWTCFEEFSEEKEGLFPAIAMVESLVKGDWRKQIQSNDYILDVDNKSINHRPDLWGHYGIAREVATFLDLKLKPYDKVVAKQKVVSFEKVSKKDTNHSFKISVQSKACSRFAGIYAGKVAHKGSDLSMAFRLLSIGAKPINLVVDLTNYVMFDIGHPMHVFDAAVFKGQEVVVRDAKVKEKILLLDDQKLTLQTSDLIVASDKEPVALAGIMGGKNSSYSDNTEEVFLEAAGFNPAVIRKTAQCFKLRTEASVRFEKHLDPMQNIAVLQRFVYLAKQYGVLKSVHESIVSVGQIIKPVKCNISHEFIEQRIGTQIKSTFIIKSLEQLGFEIRANKGVYTVLVPTTRTTKDIEIKEDILEEIVRLYGYENIEYNLPKRQMQSFDISEIQKISAIKRYFAFGCRMHELRDYLFYDESFLQRLHFDPKETIAVKHAVSENWQRLVTSLIPHLLKNVELNSVKYDSIKFFEMNRIWPTSKKNCEQQSLAGIVYNKQSVDFYDVKQQLQGLWDVLNLDVVWKKASGEIPVWYDKYKTADLYIGKQYIGRMGMMSHKFMHPILDVGQACIFELDVQYLLQGGKHKQVFASWSKYQSVTHDISMFVPLKITANTIQHAIESASAKINSVELVDFFEKAEWGDKRSLAFRYQMSDKTKTLDKKEIDEIVQSVHKAVKKHHVEIR